jgi:hypothetical protein
VPGHPIASQIKGGGLGEISGREEETEVEEEADEPHQKPLKDCLYRFTAKASWAVGPLWDVSRFLDSS